MKILGSGMAGCLTALLIPGASILEPFNETKTHQALLRFRSDKIGKTIGIPFKKVLVYKGIWHNEQPVQLSPKYIVRYARKVSQIITARSIINQEPIERFIAPENFHLQMLDMLKDRITYGASVSEIKSILGNETVINTLPMPILQDILGIDVLKNQMLSNKIYVSRYIIPNCDIHATNYYTDTKTGVYRASISGNKLIIESTFQIKDQDLLLVKRSFGLDAIRLELKIDNFIQQNGKLCHMDEIYRKKVIFELTKNYNIYSLGRFAIWKNIVMDDVLNDILRIKEWIHQSDYDRLVK